LGEGLLNDAVAVILTKTMEGYFTKPLEITSFKTVLKAVG